MGVDKRFLNRQLTAADPADHKSSVRFVVTTALPAYTRVGNVITKNSNGALIAQDGVTPVTGNSLLLDSVGSASDVDNGIYVITQIGGGGNPFILTRRSDADADDLVNSGMSFRVEEGTLYAGVEFLLTTPNPITLNTTAIVFEAVSASGGAAGFTQIDSGDTETINAKEALVLASGVRVEGRWVVNGNVKFVASPKPRTQVTARLLPSGTDIPNNSLVKVEAHGALALGLFLADFGAPGESVIVQSLSSDPGTITVVSPGGRTINRGFNFFVLTTPFETAEFVRLDDQNWAQVI